MANLAEAVDATETDWIISADVSDAIDYFTVESEIVKITANFPAQRDPQTRLMQVPRIRVERGAGGTTAASHADTTVLTPLIPPSAGGGGGGAIAVTGGGTTVNDVTEIDLGAAAVTDAGGGVAAVEQTVVSRTVTLTNAQIKALPTTPVTIIPAPGAGMMVLPVMMSLLLDWTADYTNIDVGSSVDCLLGGAHPLSVLAEEHGDVTDLLALGSDSMATMTPYQRAESQYTRSVSGDPPQPNEPLQIILENGTGDLTGGNAANVLKVTVFYVVIAL